MKRFLIILPLLFAAIATMAQTSREIIDAHPHLVIPTQAVYAGSIFARPIAEAPKGYEPFYISHYGRHGSRHESRAHYPLDVVEIFDVADSLNLLTAKGKEAKALAYRIAKAHHNRIGDLTRIGVEQHKGIARRMYLRFKPIFRRGSIIDSRSSTFTRCILSMAAFNESLKECNPLIETRMDVNQADQHIIRPFLYFTKDELYKNDEAWCKHLEEWTAKQDFSHMTNMLFTDFGKVCQHLNKTEIQVITDIYKRIAFMQNLGWHDRSFIDSIFTPEERYLIYLHENYRWYCRFVSTTVESGLNRFAPMQALVEDIIKYADLAIEGKNSASANLRFGHDYYMLGLFATLNFNECSGEADISSVEKLGEEWPAFKVVTMASNLQFVLYRSKKNPDILVRILENENDITLPIESVEGPFYKWEDVRSYMLSRVALFHK